MGENKKKYKWFEILEIEPGRWHIGVFLCKDYDQFYLMFSLIKWDIYIGKLKI